MIGDINLHNADAVAPEAKALRGRIFACKLDVTKSTNIDEIDTGMHDEFNQIDALVNNSVVIQRSLMGTIRKADGDSVFAVNLTDMFLRCHAVEPQMVARCTRKIVNVVSNVGKLGPPGKAHYVTSKFDVLGFV